MMKKVLIIFLIFILGMMGSMVAMASQRTEQTRVINLVFDDSGSMFFDEEGRPVNDSWSQAEYALEVLVSMLGVNDRLNIYFMSYFACGPEGMAASSQLTLYGSAGMVENVSRIHNRELTAGRTPFNSVRRAYQDLTQEVADQKWLVVFTDGMFQDGDYPGHHIYIEQHDLEAFFEAKDDDIQVMFFTMGHVWEDAASIPSNQDLRIFSLETETNTDILLRVTDICQRIFNLNRLVVDIVSNEFSFDVPMAELIVFAQGPEVALEGIRTPDGELIQSTESTPVSYREPHAGFEFENALVARNLVGVVSRFEGDFSAGDYQVEITGAETLEVYFRPNVDVMVYLTDADGNQIPSTDWITAGEYTINFGFVRGGTNEPVPSSELLGEITYQARITNNGVLSSQTYQPGDTFMVEEGRLTIEATANFLEINSVTSQLEYEVGSAEANVRVMTFEILENPEHYLTESGFDNEDQPIVVRVQLDGEGFSAEEWSMLDPPRVTSEYGRTGDYLVVLTDTPGILHLYPSVFVGGPLLQRTGSIVYSIEHEQGFEDEVWRGQAEIPTYVVDGIPFHVRFARALMIGLGFLALILLILWWMTRKVLPKKINRVPDSTEFRVWPGGKKIEGIPHDMHYNRKGKTLRFITPKVNKPDAEGAITLKLKAVDRRYVKSKRRRVAIVGIQQVTGNVYEIVVNHMVYRKHPRFNQWMEEAYINEEDDLRPINQTARNFPVEIVIGTPRARKSALECEVIHK